jgi:phosphonate transport system ATP-binding protein
LTLYRYPKGVFCVIKICSITKNFGPKLRALDNVSLEINQGEFVAVLGPSGAGKSTLVRCINGLVKCDSGKIYFNDNLVDQGSSKRLKDIRKSIAMIFQQFNLIERRDALNNVLMGRLGHVGTLQSLLGLFSDKDFEMALEGLKRVGLESHKRHLARNLSGGQQQRVAIARALVQNPKVLLGDEPVASLDPMTAKSILSLIKEINKKDNITVVLNMHSVDLSLEFADRIIGLREGRIVYDGPAKTITPEVLEEIYV